MQLHDFTLSSYGTVPAVFLALASWQKYSCCDCPAEKYPARGNNPFILITVIKGGGGGRWDWPCQCQSLLREIAKLWLFVSRTGGGAGSLPSVEAYGSDQKGSVK